MITFGTFEFLGQKSWWNLHLHLSHLGNKHTSFCSFLLNETFWGNFETLCLLTPKMQKYDLNSALIIWFNFIAFQIKVWHKNILPHNIVIVGPKSSIVCFMLSKCTILNMLTKKLTLVQCEAISNGLFAIWWLCFCSLCVGA